ncbi:MAG: RHS repeat-associated core domain-containing protein, partial [Phycisphaerae bacterium]|nr:RHS repeat-associated core domain-containing protein [Phycisphaerae bacterium]NIX02059.1 hypothetical protein [Phycisphaerae bacterium]
AWRADYTPFGNVVISRNTVDNPLRFPGQYFDAETGLHYNYFRDYDVSAGRYLQSDPIGLRGGVNIYSYVGANPIRYDDPLGLESFDGENFGALVPTGATFFFGSVNLLQSAFEGRINSQDFGVSAARSDLRFFEVAVVGGICEQSCSSPSSSSVKLPRDFVTLSIQIPGTRFGFEIRPERTQCLTIGFGFSPFANESQPHLPRPALADTFVSGS